MEFPDRWVMVEIRSPEHGTIRKLYTGNYGGYTGGDTWRLSSQIGSIQEQKDHYVVTTSSGNQYTLHKESEGLSHYMEQVLEALTAKLALRSTTVEIVRVS